MKKAKIVCIGRLKTDYWRQAAGHYLRLLQNFRPVEVTELKDASGDLTNEARIAQEGERILASLKSRDLPIALHERGKMLTSCQFAQFLTEADEHLQKRPVFIIGGPFGLSQTVLDSAETQISISAMTFPHELARVLLLEQLYRAENILRNTPYHH